MVSTGGRRQAWLFPLLGGELLLACVAFAVYVNGYDRWGFAVVGIICGLLTHIVFLSPRERWLSMWGLTSFTVTFSAEVRGLAIATNYPSKEFVDEFFLGAGTTFRGLGTAGLVTMASVGLLVLGYMIVSGRARRGSVPTPSRWALSANALTEAQVFSLATVYAVVGLAATLEYTRSVGGLSATISARRTTISANGADFQSYGQFEFLAQCSLIAALLLLCYWLSTRPRIGLLRSAILIVFFVNAFGLNVVTTTRAQTVDVAAAIVVGLVLIRGRVRAGLIAVLAVLVVAGIGLLTAERSSTAVDGVSNGVAYGLQSTLQNRNGYDLSKTLRIIDAVPDQIPYAYGETIGILALAPIPRALWPDKPVLTPGPIIGRAIYGQERSGVPPGLTAELYWNFGNFGVVFGSLLAGMGLAWIAHRRDLRGSRDLTALLFYLTVVLDLGKTLIGVSVGQMVTQAVQAAVLLAPIAIIGRMMMKREGESEPAIVGTASDHGTSRTVVPVER